MRVIDFDFKKNEEALSVFMDSTHSDLEHIFEHNLCSKIERIFRVYIVK